MYRGLQRDMGPYRSVCIALLQYMFTHILQVNVCSDEMHTLLDMSGLAVHYLLRTGKHHSSGAALSPVPTALVTILATDS